MKKRENISFSKLHGEKKAATFEGAETWKKDVLPTLLSEYEAINVFNADESALFYKAMPNGSLVDKNEERSGMDDRRTLGENNGQFQFKNEKQKPKSCTVL